MSSSNKKVKFQIAKMTPEGDVVALNKHDASCYDEAPTVEIPKNDFDYLMQIFDKFEESKAKRAEVQRNYFENNKKSYYERQKKWRDGHKMEINIRRRERYAERKAEAAALKSLDAPAAEASDLHEPVSLQEFDPLAPAPAPVESDQVAAPASPGATPVSLLED